MARHRTDIYRIGPGRAARCSGDDPPAWPGEHWRQPASAPRGVVSITRPKTPVGPPMRRSLDQTPHGQWARRAVGWPSGWQFGVDRLGPSLLPPQRTSPLRRCGEAAGAVQRCRRCEASRTCMRPAFASHRRFAAGRQTALTGESASDPALFDRSRRVPDLAVLHPSVVQTGRADSGSPPVRRPSSQPTDRSDWVVRDSGGGRSGSSESRRAYAARAGPGQTDTGDDRGVCNVGAHPGHYGGVRRELATLTTVSALAASAPPTSGPTRGSTP